MIRRHEQTGAHYNKGEVLVGGGPFEDLEEEEKDEQLTEID